MIDSTNPDWLPSVNLGYSMIQTSPTCRVDRHSRLTNRKFKCSNLSDEYYSQSSLSQTSELITENSEIKKLKLCNESSQSSAFKPSFIMRPPASLLKTPEPESILNPAKPLSVSEIDFASAKDAECQTEIISEDTEEVVTIENLAKVGTLEWFENDDIKCKYYTGIPNIKLLVKTFEFVNKVATEYSRESLSHFQQFTMTLMRLRLNLQIVDLAYRFNVSKSTISASFLKWIGILFVRLRRLIYWPAREDIQNSTPQSFRKYFGTKIAIIIDCYEIFIEKPANLAARAATWSNYKHHNTIKVLIGISPSGAITFVSKAYGGRASDKFITDNSNFLRNLLPNDMVLADRGFDIQESVGLYCAEVKIPAFTKGKSQLSNADVEFTRRIAHTRIHIERVIGLLRNKYQLLQSVIPITYLIRKDESEFTTIDMIITVCSALCNLCNSVVPTN